jgi:isopentenyldiphosphate isomerase
VAQVRLEDPYTDPNELFDVLDATGRPTGEVKRRADVHRDGDWHRSFHCWVLSESQPALIYQRRGLHKDTWPGRLDVTVGGHYRHGETLEDVVREVEEEIGRSVRLEDLRHLGRRVCVNEQESGIRDRELQDVFLWRTSLPLEAFRPQPVEVTALEMATIADVLRLFSGQAQHAPVERLLPDGTRTQGTISEGDFIPGLDRYFFRLAVTADLAGRDYPHLLI